MEMISHMWKWVDTWRDTWNQNIHTQNSQRADSPKKNGTRNLGETFINPLVIHQAAWVVQRVSFRGCRCFKKFKNPRWFRPWPFYPQTLEVTIPTFWFRVTWTHHPKKVTSRIARDIFSFFILCFGYPPWNKQFTPENPWLEDYFPFGKKHIILDCFSLNQLLDFFEAPMLYLFEKHHDEPVYQPAAGCHNKVCPFFSSTIHIYSHSFTVWLPTEERVTQMNLNSQVIEKKHPWQQGSFAIMQFHHKKPIKGWALGSKHDINQEANKHTQALWTMYIRLANASMHNRHAENGTCACPSYKSECQQTVWWLSQPVYQSSYFAAEDTPNLSAMGMI